MELPIFLYDNRLNDGAPAATSTATGFDVHNLRDLRTFTYWKATSNATQYITIDCGAAKTADCLAILGHNFASVGATVSLECSSDNFGADVTVALAGFTVTTDKAILKIFASQNKRYWRLKLTGMSAAPQMAVLMTGNRLQFPYPPQTPFSPYKEGIKGQSTRGRKGHILGTVIDYYSIEISARFDNLTRAFVFNTVKPFWDNHASRLKPFFFAWDIATYPDQVYFVKLKDDSSFEAPLSIGPLVDSITFEMEGMKE